MLGDQIAKTVSVPAPVKGLNARDSIATMPPDYALVADNYFFTPTSANTRNGNIVWATGLDGDVETLSHYSGGTTKKMFAVTSGKTYDITSQGAVGAASVSGLTNSRFQWVNFATSAGTFLVMVNGADLLQNYDGTNWTSVNGASTYAITGVTTSTLINVNVFKNRLWFIQKNTMSAWYLPTQSIGGAAQKYDLSSQFTHGGYLVAMMTWTIDNTNGVDEYAVFITSEGEVAVYQGYDPNFAGTFTLVGKFLIGRPVGYRCFTKMGSDNVLISADGISSLARSLTTDRKLSETFSYNIVNLINNDVALYKNNFGWQPVYYPIGNKLIINVPANENNTIYQYVMNTITGAWSTWNKENIPGFYCICWDTFQDNIYFGARQVVYQSDVGEDDAGVPIQADLKPAFNYFGELGQQKLFTLVRPIFFSDGIVSPSFALCLDYNDISPSVAPTSVGGGSLWDTFFWDTTLWGGAGTITKSWHNVGGVGYAASLRMATTTMGVQAQLQSIDYVFVPGGVL
jgi:hypothetical protein